MKKILTYLILTLVSSNISFINAINTNLGNNRSPLFDTNISLNYDSINYISEILNSHATIVNDDTYVLEEDSTCNKIFVLANDRLNEEDFFDTAISINSIPNNGFATINTNNTPKNITDDFIEYSPNTNFYGTDIFEYQICDANGNCDTASVTIIIENNTFDCPLATNDENSNLTTFLQNSVINEIHVLANDTFGGDGSDNASITLVSNALNGISSIDKKSTPNNPNDDVILYTPNTDYYGNDTITYQICDSDGDCDTAVVNIIIVPNNNETAKISLSNAEKVRF